MPDDPTLNPQSVAVRPVEGEHLVDGRAPAFLQLTDALTERRFATRIDPDDTSLSINNLMAKYVQKCPVEEYLAQNRMTPASADGLTSLQEHLYHLSDSGELQGPIHGIAFHQQGRYIAHDESPGVARVLADGTPIRVIDITIDRNAVGYERNWKGFHRRRWDKNPGSYTSFIREALETQHKPDEARRIMNLDSDGDRVRFIRAIAQRVWDSDFESYSRFSGAKLRYKTGDETVINIQAGRGAICSEKVQALKFLTDAYGLESEHILVGPEIPDPPPEDTLRQLLETFDFSFSKRHMRYWQHLAVLYHLDDQLLVDATNGNIPFLFEQGNEASKYLSYDDKRFLTVRMGLDAENFYYHRASPQLVQDLYYAMENFIPEIDLVQVFDNELGLYIDGELLVAPIVYQSEVECEALSAEYTEACEAQDLPYEITPDWTLDSHLGNELLRRNPVAAQAILDSHEHLLTRYQRFEGEGRSAGLALIGLKPRQP
ncbi:MAG: hypothetical protein IIC24_02910 [Chloroflexi bacterium]|nr:hypothetical protein [Chloroflexota bacterium]